MQAAFIFIGEGSKPLEHNSKVLSPAVHLYTFGVSTFEEAVTLAKELADQGISAIELCGAFGNIGTGMVAQAVKGKADVGVVKFDHHPAIGGQSGDAVFLP